MEDRPAFGPGGRSVFGAGFRRLRRNTRRFARTGFRLLLILSFGLRGGLELPLLDLLDTRDLRCTQIGARCGT